MSVGYDGIMIPLLLTSLLQLSHAFTTTELGGVKISDKVERAGRGVELSCVDADISGYQTKSIVWKCKGCFSISETRETIVATLNNSRYDIIVEPERMSWKGTRLAIKPTITKDSGLYFCIANTKISPALVYNLQIQDVPSTPGKPLIMSFNSTSVNLSWAPPVHLNSAPLITYKLEILEGEAATWTNYVTINTGSKESHFTVSNLRPFTVYSFRAIAVNRLGPSPPSEPSYHMMTLREPPRGKPVIIRTFNLSADSIQIEWDPPPPDTIHGEFIGYKISWKELGEREDENSVTIKEPETKEYRLSKLNSFTQYLISIQVMNPKGAGPPATVTVQTDEGVPSQPLNLSVVAVTNNGFVLQWVRPERPNGRISGYRVYYSSDNFTNVRTINSSEPVVSGEVDGLDPYRKFNIFVKAFNAKNEGNASEDIQVMTDVSGPAAPVLTNLTCPGQDSVYLEWARPPIFYHSIDSYKVYYKKKYAAIWLEKHIQVPPVDSTTSKPAERILINNLTVGSEYSIYMRAYTQSLYIESLQYPGNKSEIIHILAGKDCDRVQVSPMREGVVSESSGHYVAVILGGILVFVVLLVAVLGLAFWRRNLMSKRFYIPAGMRKEEDFLMWDIQVDNEDSGRTSIQTNMFVQHVHLLHTERDMGFLAEYQNLQQSASFTGKLEGRQDRPSTMRVYNVDTFQSRNSYTFCPSPWLVDPTEFWRHVHKSGTTLLVAVDTELDNHLPTEARSFGSLDVIPVSKKFHPSFTLKKFEVRLKRGRRNTKGENEVVVLQLKSAVHGYRKELDFLRFIRVVSIWKKTFGTPLVLSGRSLVYVAADSLILQAESTNQINIPAYIRYLGSTVGIEDLTLKDYIFLHDVMVKAIQCKGSNISVSVLPGTTFSQIFIDKQFSLCTDISSEQIQYSQALEPFNQCRNNSLDYIAPDWSRVVLSPLVDGTDYINATWLPGYTGEKEFILSQHPSPTTVSQFWEMILQTGSKLIVCLSVIPQQFWPVPQTPLVFQGLSIWLESEGSMGGYRSHQVSMERAGKTTTVELVLCPNWPHQSVPVSNCVHLVDCVNKKIPTGPVVVVDSYGATEAGIFSVLSSLVRQMDTEATVDVFYWFKAINLSRPGIWISPDNIVFVYRVLSELCSIHRN